MSRASHPATPPVEGVPRGRVKAHRIALCPNDRQASLMAGHAGWARGASNRSRDRLAAAWFTDEGGDHEGLADMNLRRPFKAVKRDRFPWSRKLSQNVAKNAIIHRGKGLEAWGVYKKARKKGQRPGPTVGIDMGIQVLATLWDGDEQTEVENPRPLREALAELRRIDKAISRSRKVHGRHRTSHRRETLYTRRRRQHAPVSRLRSDHHQTTTVIAKRGGTVKVEPLHLAGMQRNRRLGRALGNAGLGEFVRMPECKCAWYGTAFEKVDRWYPSSKRCSACGAVKQSLLLSERPYRCLPCGFACDRDENAVRNIQAFEPAARSAVADAATWPSGPPRGLPGRRSVHRTGIRIRFTQEVEIAIGSGDHLGGCSTLLTRHGLAFCRVNTGKGCSMHGGMAVPAWEICPIAKSA